MWKILRNKQPLSTSDLRNYCTNEEVAQHSISIGDILKFGRVNFKVSVLQCKGKL